VPAFEAQKRLFKSKMIGCEFPGQFVPKSRIPGELFKPALIGSLNPFRVETRFGCVCSFPVCLQEHGAKQMFRLVGSNPGGHHFFEGSPDVFELTPQP